MRDRFRHYAGRVADVLIGVLPQRFHVPLQFHKHTLLLHWEPEARLIRRYARPGSVGVDVGANRGLWTYAIAKSGLFKRVLAIEPNARLTNDLEHTGLAGMTVLHKAVSNQAGTKVLKIPRSGSQLLDGWASLESQIDVETEEFLELRVDGIRLDDLHLDGVGFVKIDVEGHESSVLEGARELFTNCRPVCLLECRDRNMRSVEAFFSDLRVGYRQIDTEASFGFQLSAGNALFAVE